MLYSQFFGWHVQERLQEAIREHHYGELLVGQAEIVETDNVDLPFLVAAPTMRVPMVLRESINPYLAARAALLLVRHGTFAGGTYAGEKIADYVDSLAFPASAPASGRSAPTPAPIRSERRLKMSSFSRTNSPSPGYMPRPGTSGSTRIG